MQKTEFSKARNLVYAYIDGLDQQNWPKGLEANVKSKCRKWLREQSAPTEDVLEIAQDMGLTDESLSGFIDLLYNKIGLAGEDEGGADGWPEDVLDTGAKDMAVSMSFSLSSYARSFKRLSRDESIEAAKICQESRFAEKELEEHSADLSKQQIRDLRAKIAAGKEARESLIMGNYGLVVSEACQYNIMGVQMDDLIQEGILGLMRAIDDFVPQRAAFSTYARIWIRKYIRSAFTELSRSIPLSVGAAESLSKVKRAAADYESRTGKSPSVEELSKMTKFTVRRIKNMLRNEQQSQSFSGDVEPQNCSRNMIGSVLETIEDPNAEARFDAILEQTKEVDIKKVLHRSLDPIEEKVILFRFGLEDGKPKSQPVVGAVLGYSKERIRQIEKRALSKLDNSRAFARIVA